MGKLLFGVMGVLSALRLGAPLAAANPFYAGDYFPLRGAPPRYYHFLEEEFDGPSTDAVVRMEFAGQQVINGRPTSELRLYMDNQYHKSLNYDNSTEGIRLHRDRLTQWPDQDLHEVYDPPLLFLPG